MKFLTYSVILLSLLFAGMSAAAQSTVVYQDDFEGTVTGWSDNRTDFDPDVTQFLGRFDNNPQTTARTFTIPANTSRVEIEFDFYRFDGWENSDAFEIEIDGVEIFSLPFDNLPQGDRSGIIGNVEWSHSALTGAEALAFGSGSTRLDQLFRFNLTINNAGATVALTLRTDLNQGGNNESGGCDNMIVTSFQTLPVPVLLANKSVETVGDSYALPGSLVEYTIAIENTGGPVDGDTLSLSDPLPPDVTLFTGDLDGLGNAVVFVDSSTPTSGVTCCGIANIEYSDTTSGEIIFGYIPTSDFDPAVTHIRITPSGTVRDAQTDPVNIAFKFQARIN